MSDLRSLRLSKLRLGDDSRMVKLLMACIQVHQKLQYLNLSECLFHPKQLVGIIKILPLNLNSLILSDNPLSKTSPDRKDFLTSLKEFMQNAKYTLTLIDLSNMFLGFTIILELITNSLPDKMLSIDLSGNQLSKSQIEIIRHCLGINKRAFQTV